jgi:(E)-4-hydroxy-3-methylbut-2-enyl-diphosphate synthase
MMEKKSKRGRRKTRRVLYGDVAVGGGSPVSIQSMCTCPASNVEEALAEIGALSRAGCQIVRVAVRDEGDLASLPEIIGSSPMPVIADIHFHHALAVGSARAGAAGLRINPGNIGSREKVREVVDAAGAAGIPIRIGVNSGSLDRRLRGLSHSEPARALSESAAEYMRMLEEWSFRDIVFSLKSSDPQVTIEANTLFAATCDYPIHAGVTEAGPPLSGAARSAVALTKLLSSGIGDTIRVSLSGDPVNEVIVAAALLTSLGLRGDFPRIVSCPTCGRCHMDVAGTAERLEREIIGCGAGISVAVMGCEVNGPGEAREADIGIAGSPKGAVLFRKGEIVRTIEGDPLKTLLDEVRALLGGA